MKINKNIIAGSNELKIKDKVFEIGFIDDANSYLNLLLITGKVSTVTGCCSLNEMEQHINEEINQLSQMILAREKAKLAISLIKEELKRGSKSKK